MLFNHGRRHCCDSVNPFGSEDLNQFWHMFKRKYWGNISNDLWDENNKAAESNNGEIHAAYRNERGMELLAVRTPDCSVTIFYTPDDVLDGTLARVIEAYTQQSRPRARTFGDLSARYGFSISGNSNRRG